MQQAKGREGEDMSWMSGKSEMSDGGRLIIALGVVRVRVGILTRVIGCVWGIVEEPEESEVRERATEPRDLFVCRFGHDVVHLPRILE